MNIDEFGRFDPERLAKWLKVSREYLFAPLAEAGSAAVEEASRCTDAESRCRFQLIEYSGKRRENMKFLRNTTTKGRWLIVLGCACLPGMGLAAEPLALQGIMKDLGRNMQAVVDGLTREDYAAAEKAALAIADHPQPPVGEKMRVMAYVGTSAPRFKAFDGETHDNATALARAAKSGNGEEAIAAFHKLQLSCLGCHQAFRKPFQEHFYGKAAIR